MNLELEGRVAIVTGASRGLGEAAARALREEGAKILAVGRDRARLEALEAEGGEVHGVVADLAEPRAAADLAALAVERFGRLDAVVNNAAVAPARPFLEEELDNWRRVFDVNVASMAMLTQAAARIFVDQGHGKVVNIASTTGLRGKPGLVAYSSSKGAVVQFTKALAAELAAANVQVNAIAPGAFKTEAQRAVLEDPDLLTRRTRRIPARRMAEPREFGPLVCYLASPLADFVTGSIFVIDGGEEAKL